MRLRNPWLALPMFRSLAGALRLPAAGLAAGGGVALAAPQERPKIFLVGGPSGAGKDTLLLGARDALKNSGAVRFLKDSGAVRFLKKSGAVRFLKKSGAARFLKKSGAGRFSKTP